MRGTPAKGMLKLSNKEKKAKNVNKVLAIVFVLKAQLFAISNT